MIIQLLLALTQMFSIAQLYTMKTEAYMDLEFPYIKLTQILRALTV